MEVPGRYSSDADPVFLRTCRTSLSRGPMPIYPRVTSRSGLTSTPTLASHASSRILQDHPGSTRIFHAVHIVKPPPTLPFSTPSSWWPISFLRRRKLAVVVLPVQTPPSQGHATRRLGLSLARHSPRKDGWEWHGKGKRDRGKMEKGGPFG